VGSAAAQRGRLLGGVAESQIGAGGSLGKLAWLALTVTPRTVAVSATSASSQCSGSRSHSCLVAQGAMLILLMARGLHFPPSAIGLFGTVGARATCCAFRRRVSELRPAHSRT
jgi:hypothetical protein